MTGRGTYTDFPVTQSQFIRVTRFGAWEMHFQCSHQVRLGTYPLVLNREFAHGSLSGLNEALEIHERQFQTKLRDLLEGTISYEECADTRFDGDPA